MIDSQNLSANTHDRFEASKREESNMLKALVLCTLLSRKAFEINGLVDRFSTDNAEQDEEIQDLQVAVLNDPLLERANLSNNFNSADKKIVTHYITAKGIGALKVHRIKLKWNSARQICNEEGGHLVVLRSVAEVQLVKRLMTELSVFQAWVGWHDQFEEGDWTSVLDEPIHDIAGILWPSDYPNDFHDIWNCGAIVMFHGDMTLYDDNCVSPRPFVCKIYLS